MIFDAILCTKCIATAHARAMKVLLPALRRYLFLHKRKCVPGRVFLEILHADIFKFATHLGLMQQGGKLVGIGRRGR